MDANVPTTTTTTNEIEHVPYFPLSDHPSVTIHQTRRPLKVFAATFASIIFLLSLVALIISNNQSQKHEEAQLVPQHNNHRPQTTPLHRAPQEPRGIAQGVSSKSNPYRDDDLSTYNWTNEMFAWQRTAFHFQPEKNWMNDPNGPMFHRGWYHLFYQYNPDSAVWGNITWGHTVSRDLIHWLYLPIAMVPDQWYDINGVWTGSATQLPTGEIVVLYTGDTNGSVQVQNLAYPANLSDPLLLHWIKYPGNPVMTPPTGIGSKNFRDPTTAWVGPNNTWHIGIGSKINETGLAMVFRTSDFMTYDLIDGYLHEVPGTGMWECLDFYPVAINGSNGLDTSVYGPGVKHVIKASLDDTKVDHFAIGTYNMSANKWTPDNPYQDLGIALRYDYGRYYASKTFYDQSKERRILWGWINETDLDTDDLQKGWASVQTVPRTVLFDNKTGANLLQWPVEELESLRLNCTEFEDVVVEPGSTVPLNIGKATQLDIFAEFEMTFTTTNATNEDYNCSGGAPERSAFGPFGLLVLADETFSESTPIFFRQVNTTDDGLQTYFCADETRSSLATDVFRTVYGSTVPVLGDENLHMRVLVDHSIVESFAQGGRTVITSRIYPTEAIYGNARLFLFNNATGVSVKAMVKVWELNSAFIHPYPLDPN